MKRKLIVFSLLGIICFPFFYSEPNFENKQVPGIVEGTAKMINTKIYFGNNQLKTAKVKIKIIANYTENLKIDIGYKPPTDPLMEEFTPIKKITIWERKNLFETESNYITFLDDYEEISSIKRKSGFISEEWDLFSIGFISDDYVKADERIWYLKITCLEKKNKMI